MTRHFVAAGHVVAVIGRGSLPASVAGPRVRFARWDGRTLDPTWAKEIDGADVVLNLAGRSVDCRYNKRNLSEMLFSRLDSARVVGEAIAAASSPPSVWLQMSTATIYAHTEEGENDEQSGVIGGFERGAEPYWRYSVHIAQAWERAQSDAATPTTRKVALRSAMVMSREPGGPFRVLAGLVRCGLGGPIAGGRMSLSWIHEKDFAGAIDLLIADGAVSGPVNLAAPEPLPQREFMAAIGRGQKTSGRRGFRVPLALPAYRWMIHAGAVLLRTDPELILKSRRVVSSTLREHGFKFEFPRWSQAAIELTAGADS
ncbi:MAG: hypothetical protein ACJA2W_002398 [Planctomycetota bacterium]|jgi:uncharacterized protein (TIGR01777 family)